MTEREYPTVFLLFQCPDGLIVTGAHDTTIGFSYMGISALALAIELSGAPSALCDIFIESEEAWRRDLERADFARLEKQSTPYAWRLVHPKAVLWYAGVPAVLPPIEPPQFMYFMEQMCSIYPTFLSGENALSRASNVFHNLGACKTAATPFQVMQARSYLLRQAVSAAIHVESHGGHYDDILVVGVTERDVYRCAQVLLRLEKQTAQDGTQGVECYSSSQKTIYDRIEAFKHKYPREAMGISEAIGAMEHLALV